MYKNYEHFTDNYIESEIIENSKNQDNEEIIIDDTEDNQVEDTIPEITEESTQNTEEITESSENNLILSQEDIDSNLEIVNDDRIKEKIKNKEILRLSDFDKITDVVDKQILEDEERQNKMSTLKKGVKIAVYLVIGLLICVIIGAFLNHIKKTKKESILDDVEPPRLY